MTTGLNLVLWTGLAAGVLHVLSGVDHLAALMPLSMGRNWRAWLLGARWGIGHSTGVLIVGGLAVALKSQMNMAAVGQWGERLVGVMLIAIGAFGLRYARRMSMHVHTHSHDGHEHSHVGAATAAHTHDAPSGLRTRTALFAGVIHGVAGTSHLLGVLPAVAMASRLSSGSYLLAFALGSILAMSAFAAFIGRGSVRLGEGAPRVLRPLMAGVSCLTIAIGLVWILLPLLGGKLP